MTVRSDRHMKRIAAPKRYHINRKASVYLANTRAGPHKKDDSLPLVVVIRDTLKLINNAREAKKILNEKKVLIDQTARKDLRFPCGLMDVVTIPENKTNYRVVFKKDNMIGIIPIAEAESKVKLCKIMNKSKLKNGVMQLNLHDGKNILVKDDTYKAGDSVLISLPDQSIKKHLKFETGARVYITNGTHTGEEAELMEVKSEEGSREDRVILKAADGQNFETLKKYVFITGKAKPEIKISES